MKLIPRLPTAHAVSRLKEIEERLREGVSPASLVEFEHPGAHPNPTGGSVAAQSDLREWRNSVLAQVEEAPRQDRYWANLHGIYLGRAIESVFNPIPADAGHDGVWSFLSLMVFPDVVTARWPMSSDSDQPLPRDRWIGAQVGRDRNYLKLSWRRWRLLGEIMTQADPPLGEDEMVNLLERTSLARNVRLTRIAARRIVAYDPDAAAGGRMMFARLLMKAIAHQTGARMLDVLADQALTELVEELAEQSLEEMNSSDGSPE